MTLVSQSNGTSEGSPRTQAERLREALRETRLSRRALAVLLTGKDRPAEGDIASKKSQLVRWLNATHGIGDENAERIWEAFESVAPGRFGRDYFKAARAAPPTWAEEMSRLASHLTRVVSSSREEYQADLRELRSELRGELDGLREEQRREYAEILDQLRRLKDVS